MTIHAHPTHYPRGEIIGTGLVVLDRIHVENDEPVVEELGGSCGNVLISLAMLGRSVAPLLRLGSDAVGGRLERELCAAGADTRLVSRRRDVNTPVIVQLLDLKSSNHRFSFNCPKSDEPLGSFESITIEELEPARSAIASCSIFYTDRLSATICDAMEIAAEGGAIIHFEPSGICEAEQFERALSLAHIFKYSIDRLPGVLAERARPDAFCIVTAGNSGLKVRHAGAVYRCEAHDAPAVRDTCGAGDMVTSALLDRIIEDHVRGPASLSIRTVLAGIRSGQRLAAANCAHIGARGIFRERGPAHARALLTGG
jgi:fructokinase